MLNTIHQTFQIRLEKVFPVFCIWNNCVLAYPSVTGLLQHLRHGGVIPEKDLLEKALEGLSLELFYCEQIY